MTLIEIRVLNELTLKRINLFDRLNRWEGMRGQHAEYFVRLLRNKIEEVEIQRLAIISSKGVLRGYEPF